ncbi:hypothetical protein MLD38_015627 [Melastoma candidum]|uniref:Uncharacterized protein n=1 Tax=Melastoma candidum TaxID=119954 RepID=A0ACB9RKW7_9MYRT|nr:hypothetical protein MLD38_015627 [Melastoma candidum]
MRYKSLNRHNHHHFLRHLASSTPLSLPLSFLPSPELLLSGNALPLRSVRCPKLESGLLDWMRDKCDFRHSRFSRILASHAYAQTGRFHALNCNLRQLLEEEGQGSAEGLCQLLSSGFSDWGSHGLVWDALAFAYLRLRMVYDALFVLNKMKDMGLRVSTLTYNSLLYNLRKTDIMWDMYRGMKLHNVLPSECTHSIIVDGFCEQYRLQDAITFMWDIDLEFGPSVTSYNTLMSRFCMMGFMDIAQSYLCKMMKCGLEPDTYSYNILIYGLCRASSVGEALKYASDMANQGLGPDEVTYNIFTKCLHLLHPANGDCKVIGTTLLTKDVVSLSQNILLGEILRAASLGSLCSGGRVAEALEVFDKMEANDLIQGTLTYSILISSLCKAGDVERAIVLYKKLVSKRMFPDSFAHSALLVGLWDKEFSIEARMLFDALVNGGFTENVIWYNVMIDHYAQVGRIDEAVQIFQKLAAKGISPSIITFNSLILGLCKHRKTSDTWQWIETMKQYGLCPTTRTYTIIMNGHFEEGDIDQMLELLHQMEQNSVMPNHVTYTIVMKGLCQKKRLQEAIGLLKVMRSRGLKPDERTYNTLIQYSCQVADVEVALKLYDEMLVNNLEPTLVTHDLLVNGLCRLRDLRELFLGPLGSIHDASIRSKKDKVLIWQAYCSPEMEKLQCLYQTVSRFVLFLTLMDLLNKWPMQQYVLSRKVACNADPIDDDVMIQAVRRMVGYDIQLRADANMRWTYEEAMKFAYLVKGFNLQYVEAAKLR